MQTITALLDKVVSWHEIREQLSSLQYDVSAIRRKVLAEDCGDGMAPEQQAEIIALNTAQQRKVDALAADPK